MSWAKTTDKISRVLDLQNKTSVADVVAQNRRNKNEKKQNETDDGQNDKKVWWPKTDKVMNYIRRSSRPIMEDKRIVNLRRMLRPGNRSLFGNLRWWIPGVIHILSMKMGFWWSPWKFKNWILPVFLVDKRTRKICYTTKDTVITLTSQ